MFVIEPVGRAEIPGYAMLNHSVLLQNLIEHFEWAAAVHHEILRDDFKPIDHWFLGQYVPVMRYAQANADAVFGETVITICWHSEKIFGLKSRRLELRLSSDVKRA